jgi:organic radical activating enzyme
MNLTESRIKFDRRDPRMNALPEGIAIETVMACNLRCPMCPVPNPETEMNGRHVTLMSMDVFRRIIDQISDRRRGVMLTGMGEPLLHPRIVEFASITRKAGHHTAIITNGTKLTREKSIALIAAGVDNLTMSVDGFTKETYEKQRIGGSYETVRRNLDDLIEVNAERGNPMRIDLNYVVTAATAHEREAFYREFSPRVTKINFLALTDWGGQVQIPADFGTPEQGHGRERVVCFALWSTMFISAEGRAMLCCADFRQESRLSSVDERPLLDIWRTEVGEHRGRHVKDDFDSRPCSTCHLNRVDARLSREVRSRMLRDQTIETVKRRMLPARLLPASARKLRETHSVPIGHIDLPRPAAEVSGVIDVHGWALPRHGHEIDRVEVRVDDVGHGRAEWGFPRADVGELHPGVGHSFCAFSYVLDTRTLSNGPHVIDVLVLDNASHRSVIGERHVTVRNDTPRPVRFPLSLQAL